MRLKTLRQKNRHIDNGLFRHEDRRDMRIEMGGYRFWQKRYTR